MRIEADSEVLAQEARLQPLSCRVRQVNDLFSGFLNGSGTGAEFNLPTGAATLPDGSVVVADSNNNVIRRVDLNGAVTTFAGDGSPNVNDGPVLSAEFNAPRDVASRGAWYLHPN